jgi:putative component of membrane protein insertase Oxa1/YidC/SpoIIIJ protein YidD
MCNQMPSQEEQDMVWEYCYKRELYRPDATIPKALIRAGVFLTGISLAACGLYWLCTRPGSPGLFYAYPVLTKIAVWFFCLCVGAGLYSRKIIIGLVRLYQHYAPEKMRRKCLLKPTCSEYMILAVQKYGAVRGVYKGVYRLFRTCRGSIYRIDYP